MAQLIEGDGSYFLYRNSDGSYYVEGNGEKEVVRDYGSISYISNMVAAESIVLDGNTYRTIVFDGGHTWFVDSDWSKEGPQFGDYNSLGFADDYREYYGLNSSYSGNAPDYLEGSSSPGGDWSDFNDGERLEGTPGSDFLSGLYTDDHFYAQPHPFGDPGPDTFDGQGGEDTVYYPGNLDRYIISGSANELVVESLDYPNSVDTLKSIEYLEFPDVGRITSQEAIDLTPSQTKGTISNVPVWDADVDYEYGVGHQFRMGGGLSSVYDHDNFGFKGLKPGSYSVMFVPKSGSYTDYRVSVRDSDSNVLASNKNKNGELIDVEITETGDYRLTVEDAPESNDNDYIYGHYNIFLTFETDSGFESGLGAAPSSSGDLGLIPTNSVSNLPPEYYSDASSGSKNDSGSSSGSKNDSGSSSGSKNSPTHNEISGSKNADNLNGTSGDDRISADGGDDVIQVSFGQDLISGGVGRDTLKFTSASTEATLEDRTNAIWETQYTHLITHNGGQIRFEGVERLHFSDKNYALDTDSTETGAGMVARLLIASFGSDNLDSFLGTGISLADGGQTKAQLLELIVGSNLVSSITGVGPSDEDFVTAIFENVVGSEPDAFQTAVYTNIASSQGRTAVLELAADNQLTADLLEDSITTLGLAYTSGL